MLVLDDEFVKAADMDEAEIKLELAILLFTKDKVSSRKAATLAGITWLDFVKELSKRELSIFDEECVMHDIETVKKFGK